MSAERSTGESLRLFVAIELPEGWLQTLSEAQARLRGMTEAGAGPRLRWVRPEGIHLTLKFLGQVASTRLAALEEALATAVDASPGFSLRLGELGSFSTRRRVSVLWAGIGGDTEALASLAQIVDAACAGLGFSPETRPFAAHLTLARVPDGVVLDAAALGRMLSAVHLNAPAFVVERVSLMRSHLGPGGARYERLAAWPA